MMCILVPLSEFDRASLRIKLKQLRSRLLSFSTPGCCVAQIRASRPDFYLCSVIDYGLLMQLKNMVCVNLLFVKETTLRLNGMICRIMPPHINNLF